VEKSVVIPNPVDTDGDSGGARTRPANFVVPLDDKPSWVSIARKGIMEEGR
jgi:hypothetical protein